MSLHIPTRFHVTTVVGLQYGDEGKGKIVQQLASSGLYDISARFNGGPNAGHTIYYEDKHKVVTHVVPTGVIAGIRINFIGPGCVVDPVLLKKEIEELMALGINHKTIYLSELVPLITPYDRDLDGFMNGKIGTTGRGIGPAYANRAHRIGPNIASCLAFGPDEQLSSYLSDLFSFYNGKWAGGLSIKEYTDKSIIECTEWLDSFEWILKNINIAKKDFLFSDGEAMSILGGNPISLVLAEGAQAMMLDNTFGTYPFVTSSNCLPSAVYSGLGLPGSAKLDKVIGVFKAYNTRVGEGPFSTEVFGEVADKIRTAGCEFGSTTKRPRRIGWIDLTELRYAVELSGATDLYMTKADVLSPKVVDEVRVCTSLNSGGKPRSWKTFEPFVTTGVKKPMHINGSLHQFIVFLEEQLGQHIPKVSLGVLADDLVSTRAEAMR